MTETERFKETITPEEGRLIEQSVAVTTEKIHREIQADGVLRRDAHPKHHGCVRGTFTVLNGIPNEAKFGIFAKSASWPVWARFSNASLIPKTLDDRVPDARGMAFKFIGVPGAKLLPKQEDSTNLDFTMVNISYFIARDIGEYNEQLTNATYALTHPRFALLLARALSRHVEDPLHEQYFSIGADSC
jgi:catalase